jgi:hypothetical protein
VINSHPQIQEGVEQVGVEGIVTFTPTIMPVKKEIGSRELVSICTFEEVREKREYLPEHEEKRGDKIILLNSSFAVGSVKIVTDGNFRRGSQTGLEILSQNF